jgi:hypothetical protein
VKNWSRSSLELLRGLEEEKKKRKKEETQGV